jgi:hypothetical protein
VAQLLPKFRVGLFDYGNLKITRSAQLASEAQSGWYPGYHPLGVDVVTVLGGGGEGKRVKTLSLQEPGSGQIQYTSWRNFAPFTTPIRKDIQASAQALGTAGDRQWVRCN